MADTKFEPHMALEASPTNQGFMLSFANGYTVSIRWGLFNYCDNRELDWRGMPNHDYPVSRESGTAEIAAMRPDGSWYVPPQMADLFGPDTVAGHVTPDQVAQFIYLVSTVQA